MKWILRILGLLILLILFVLLIGLALPEHTTHTRTITLKQPPDKVFGALADIKRMPAWNRNLEKVDSLSPIDGKETTRQTFKDGMAMTVITVESMPPAHLVREINDGDESYTGSWSYGITPIPDGGSQVALTELSNIPNPFFRVMIRLFGPTRFMDEHLEDLAKHFGETATIR